ncbi:hypothetical protein [Corynebacterium accolens]|uniref:hypothetical protein n=1 Tax=Corynebacterium accolens TaxID=38284 RepID=UPI001EDB8FAF|nr:hypothetical protein [Corynebacterium accolens]
MPQTCFDDSELNVQVEANAPFGLFNIEVTRDPQDGEPVIRLHPTFGDWWGAVDFSIQEIRQFIEKLGDAEKIAKELTPINLYPVGIPAEMRSDHA